MSSFIKEGSFWDSSFIAFSISLFCMFGMSFFLFWHYWSGFGLSYRKESCHVEMMWISMFFFCLFPLGTKNGLRCAHLSKDELNNLKKLFKNMCNFLWSFGHVFLKNNLENYQGILFDSCACICCCAYYLLPEKHTPYISVG